MRNAANSRVHTARWIGNFSLLAAIFACLMLWSGIVLLLTNPLPPQVSSLHARPKEPMLPRPVVQLEGVSQARRSLADLLLFWLPIGLGTAACGAGVAALAWGQGHDQEASRRALIALLLSSVPGCLCTLWFLVFTVSPILGR